MASRRSQQLLWDASPSVRRVARSARSSPAVKVQNPRSSSLSTGSNASRAALAVSRPARRQNGGDSGGDQRCSFVAARRPASSTTTSNDNTQPGILSTTKEHSPGNTTATLSISNPSKLNIVNSSLLDQFTQQCHTLARDPTLRAVVLSSAPTAPGKAASWIGGADIKEMAQLSSSAQARAFIDRIHHACEALRAIPVPVIASIDGFCLGAGMEIAASCDLRIATKGSLFGMPEVKVGIPSVVEAAYLPGLIGMGRTRRLLYLAENIDAVTAERWGFVEKVVEDGEGGLGMATAEWVDALVGMGPKAIRTQKVLMQRWEECGVQEGIELGAQAYAEAFEDGGVEPKEFMGRFLGRKR